MHERALYAPSHILCFLAFTQNMSRQPIPKILDFQKLFVAEKRSFTLSLSVLWNMGLKMPMHERVKLNFGATALWKQTYFHYLKRSEVSYINISILYSSALICHSVTNSMDMIYIYILNIRVKNCYSAYEFSKLCTFC